MNKKFEKEIPKDTLQILSNSNNCHIVEGKDIVTYSEIKNKCVADCKNIEFCANLGLPVNRNVEYIYYSKVLGEFGDQKPIHKSVYQNDNLLYQARYCYLENKWISNMNGVVPIPYNLLEIIKAKESGAKHVYKVDSEPKAEILIKRGFLATCFTKKADKKDLKGLDIINIPEEIDVETATEEELKKHSKTEKSKKQINYSGYDCIGLVENDNCYWNDKGYAISNFVLNLEKIVKSEETEAHVLIKLQGGKECSKIIPIDAFTSATKFRKALNEESFSFKGLDSDVQDIKLLMARNEYLTVKGVEACGVHKIDNREEYVFVSDKAIDCLGNEVLTIKQINSRVDIRTNILDHNPITKNEILEISKHMFNFNDLAICGTIFGFMAGCFFKQKMKAIKRKYGHLFIQGQSGAGKSETVDNIITPFFGLISSPLSASSIKEFATYKAVSSSNAVPLLIDEYKPSKMSELAKNIISNVARSAYDGHLISRGKPDQSVVNYDLQSPLIIIGEAGADETAISERSIELLLSKMLHTPKRKLSFEKLRNKSELLTKLGRSILNLALTKPIESMQKELKAISNDVIQEIKVDRIRNSLENCIFGLWQLAMVFENAGLTFEECTGYEINEVVTAINNSVKNDLGECGRSKSTVDKIIETFDTMAVNELLIENVDYKFLNSGAELALNTKRFYDRFLKYCKDYNSSIEALDRNSFQKQLKTMPYFENYKSVKFGEENLKTFTLSTHKLEEHKLDLQRLLRVLVEEPFDSKVVQVSFKK